MPTILFEYIKPIIDIYPGRLETLHDFLKFHMLFFRWHQDLYQSYLYGLKETSFYTSPEFQQWAVYGNEPSYGNGLMKLPMKKIIQSIFPDNHYYNNKKTRSSVLFTKRLDWVFLLEDFTVIKSKEAFKNNNQY